MAHLGLLEQKLNQDGNARSSFLQDPVGYLLREGIMLSPKQQRYLLDAVSKLKATSARPRATANKLEIEGTAGILIAPRVSVDGGKTFGD